MSSRDKIKELEKRVEEAWSALQMEHLKIELLLEILKTLSQETIAVCDEQHDPYYE